MRSEFDYSTKKKFVEMVNNRNPRLKASNLEELNKGSGEIFIKDDERQS